MLIRKQLKKKRK